MFLIIFLNKLIGSNEATFCSGVIKWNDITLWCSATYIWIMLCCQIDCIVARWHCYDVNLHILGGLYLPHHHFLEYHQNPSSKAVLKTVLNLSCFIFNSWQTHHFQSLSDQEKCGPLKRAITQHTDIFTSLGRFNFYYFTSWLS